MSGRAPHTGRASHGSPDFQNRANAFLDVAQEEDIWSISDDTEESDVSENGVYASDGGDDSGFSPSRVDLRELEALIARLHAHGAEFVRPKTTQKHRDIHTLVAAAPRASGPTIVPRGSIPGLPEPFLTSINSEGVRAQREGLRWLKVAVGGKGEGGGKSSDGKSRKRALRLEFLEHGEAKTVIKKRKKKPTETELHQERIANASRPMTDIERKRRGREIMWAQHLAAQREAEESSESDDDDAVDVDDAKYVSDAEPSVAGTASAPSSPKVAQPKEVPVDGGRVLLTVCWRARTRARSGVQPTPVVSVPVAVVPGETCMRFITRMITMPPGGVYIRDTQLSWGDCVLDPLQMLDGAQTGAWRLDLRSKTPQELTLRVPVGSTLANGKLREAAGEAMNGDGGGGGVDDGNDDEPQKSGSDDNGSSGAASGSVSNRSLFAVNVKDLSHRALHPGKTCPKGMAKVLSKFHVVKHDQACSLVDVGSGDGSFAAGLARAFPTAGVCGIEAQRDLYEESLRFENDANFICGLAERELEKCHSANVVISTTHNFDASSVEAMIRVTARLPSVTHLILGESSLCTARCKAVVGPCCCFAQLGSEEVRTHWGNSHLTFSVYKRVARWMLEGNSAERVSHRATLAKLESGEIDPTVPILVPTRRKDSKKRKTERKNTGEAGGRRDKKSKGEDSRAKTKTESAHKNAAHDETPDRTARDRRAHTPLKSKSPVPEKHGRSPSLVKSLGYVNRLLRTMV
tara:strand:+ start:26574 stop:28811 length:2238 start_codon:yes stop_codon:yes gene_type:complete